MSLNLRPVKALEFLFILILGATAQATLTSRTPIERLVLYHSETKLYQIAMDRQVYVLVPTLDGPHPATLETASDRSVYFSFVSDLALEKKILSRAARDPQAWPIRDPYEVIFDPSTAPRFQAKNDVDIREGLFQVDGYLPILSYRTDPNHKFLGSQWQFFEIAPYDLQYRGMPTPFVIFPFKGDIDPEIYWRALGEGKVLSWGVHDWFSHGPGFAILAKTAVWPETVNLIHRLYRLIDSDLTRPEIKAEATSVVEQIATILERETTTLSDLFFGDRALEDLTARAQRVITLALSNKRIRPHLEALESAFCDDGVFL